MAEKPELTVITIEQERQLRDCLFDFVIRVMSTSNRCPEEIAILPDMTKLLLDYHVEKY